MEEIAEMSEDEVTDFVKVTEEYEAEQRALSVVDPVSLRSVKCRHSVSLFGSDYFTIPPYGACVPMFSTKTAYMGQSVNLPTFYQNTTCRGFVANGLGDRCVGDTLVEKRLDLRFQVVLYDFTAYNEGFSGVAEKNTLGYRVLILRENFNTRVDRGPLDFPPLTEILEQYDSGGNVSANDYRLGAMAPVAWKNRHRFNVLYDSVRYLGYPQLGDIDGHERFPDSFECFTVSLKLDRKLQQQYRDGFSDGQINKYWLLRNGIFVFVIPVYGQQFSNEYGAYNYWPGFGVRLYSNFYYVDDH